MLNGRLVPSSPTEYVNLRVQSGTPPYFQAACSPHAMHNATTASVSAAVFRDVKKGRLLAAGRSAPPS